MVGATVTNIVNGCYHFKILLLVFLIKECSAIRLPWLPMPSVVALHARSRALSLPARFPVRGGSFSPTTTTSAEEQLRGFLETKNETGKFFIPGWRWHTMSVKREAERLQKLAQRMERQLEQQQSSSSSEELTQLKEAVDYVVGFNLNALHRVEDMFFPWTRKNMEKSSVADQDIKKAFNKVVDGLQKDQRNLANLGKTITQTVAKKTEGKSNLSPAAVAHSVATETGAMIGLVDSMLERERSLIMPIVGLCVPEKTQKKFNNQVIKFLGVLEARCHLVHMHEVVEEANCAKEQELWKESIPSLPRSMVPRWKRTLYDPMTRSLELASQAP